MKMNKEKRMFQANRMLAALVVVAMVFSMSTVVMADSEPNDSIYTAEAISDGDTVYGTLDSTFDTRDYYEIYLNYGETLDVTMTGTGDDFDLELYDDDEWEVDSSSSFDSTESLSYAPYSSGYYYIVPYAWSGSGSYTLTVDVMTSGGGGTGIGNYYVGGPSYVTGDPLCELPTLTVGNSRYFGGVKDIGEEFQDQIEEGLAEVEEMGFDVSVDVSGGAGAYFGWEIASNSVEVEGNTCYDIVLTGALAIDLGVEASVDGSYDLGDYGGAISIDGDGSLLIEVEVNLDGHLYLTVDELALAKLTLTLTADAHLDLQLDATMSATGQTQKINADATFDMDGAQLDFNLMFDPPLDIFQFGTGNGADGIYEGKEWYVPPVDTDVSGSLTASGTASYDYDVTIPGETAESDSGSVNLAEEIGDNSFFETIPGGEPDYWYGDGGTMFTCTYATGNIFIIETSLGDAFGMIDTGTMFPGTRQFDIGGYEDMLPSTGFQFDSSAGMITGMTMDGEAMTSEVTEAEVESFTEDPLGELADAGISGSVGGSSIMLILLIGVIVIVVVVVVVVMVGKKKKTPPAQQYPQQQYPPQGYTQQPQYYQQQPPPPPQQPPQGQYPPPPPPPPPGQ